MVSLVREDANREAAAAGATMRCTATTVCASPFVAPRERLFSVAAAMNMNTESAEGAPPQPRSEPRRVTNALDPVPVMHIDASCGTTRTTRLHSSRGRLKLERGVDDHMRCDTGRDDAPVLQTADATREQGELDDTVQTPAAGQPQTDGRRADVEPAKLDWCLPDQRDERHRDHVEQRDHGIAVHRQ
jgi:hypothetical protein